MVSDVISCGSATHLDYKTLLFSDYQELMPQLSIKPECFCGEGTEAILSVDALFC